MQIMRPGAQPTIRILRVDQDGNARGEIGPGAVVGERAILESGHRTASLTAVTGCSIAVAERGCIDLASLERIADVHRLETRVGDRA
jgi:CRP-like cAMP-binding protein